MVRRVSVHHRSMFASLQTNLQPFHTRPRISSSYATASSYATYLVGYRSLLVDHSYKCAAGTQQAKLSKPVLMNTSILMKPT